MRGADMFQLMTGTPTTWSQHTGYNATQNAQLAALLDMYHTSSGHVDLAETQRLSAKVAAKRHSSSRHHIQCIQTTFISLSHLQFPTIMANEKNQNLRF